MNGPSGGNRLPVAPRERKPALAALAVLLILVGALGATVMVMRAGDKVSAVELMTDIGAGDSIPRGSIKEVMVAGGTDVHYILWKQREDLIAHYHAQTALKGGSVLVLPMLSKQADILAPGTSLVGLSVKGGQYPSGLADGLTVAAYDVGDDAKSGSSDGSGGSAAGGGRLISDNLVIKDTGSVDGDGDDTRTVTVVADASDAGALSVASAAGDVSLVLVPGKH